MLVRAAAILIGILVLATCACAGTYQLAYWRELGAYENQSPPAGEFGFYYVWINVRNEDGTPRANVPIFSGGGNLEGTTDSNGNYCNFLVRDEKTFYCYSPDQSDRTPLFSQFRYPHWGHCSWEAGFVYRSSSTPAGDFDTNYEGVLNSNAGAECYLCAPFTRSMAYMFADPMSTCSDEFASSGSCSEIGQTFVAAGDRVIAAKAWVTGVTGYKVQILEGGPNGAPVGPVANAPALGEWQRSLAGWPFDAVPVTPGNTYYLKITSSSGAPFNVMRTKQNNYSSGCMYENKSALAGYDIMGAVIMAWSGYGTRGRISGFVQDVTGLPIAGAKVTANAYTAQTNESGCYTIYNVPAGTYTVTAYKPGYSKEVLYGRVVTAGATKTVDFGGLKQIVNQAINAGFEDGLTGWTSYGSFNTYNGGDWAVPAHSGGKWGGNVVSGGMGGGSLSQQVDVTGDYEYMLSAWILTDAFDGDRTIEYPTHTTCRVGIDPTGSGNQWSTSITWSGQIASYCRWSEISIKKNAQPPYAQMTVWLQYSMGYAHEWNKAGFDDVSFGRSQPVIYVDIDPVVSNITSSGARIAWHTNVASDARVDYGLTPSYGESTTLSESATYHYVLLSGLQPNTTYHFKVTSSAPGYDSGSSGDFTFTTARSYADVARIADLDALSDGTDVKLSGKLITAGVDQLGNMFYMQEPDSFWGIRVNFGDAAIHEGDVRDVYGTLNTVDGERCIDCTQTTLISSGGSVKPCGVRLDSVGGVAVGLSWGIDTVGTLVRTWGTVGAAGTDYFWLVAPGGEQVKVFCGSLAKPSGFAAVTACCGKTLTGGAAPVLRVRKQSDITPYP